MNTVSKERPGSGLERRFFRLTFVNILTNLSVPLAGLVDTAMLGHLSDIRFLAGVALAGVIFDFVYWSCGFLRMGTTGTTAQAMGRGHTREAERILRRSMAIGLTGGALLLISQVALADLGFGLLTGSPEVEAAGREYFHARIWGAPATLANMVLLGWFLGREESRLALAMTVTANVVNVSLNYLFIIRLGMAAQGAGLATMLSQYAMLTVAVALYLPRRQDLDESWRQLLGRARMAGLLVLHRDILIRTLLLTGSIAVFINLGALLGTAVLAANTLLFRLFTLSAYLVDGAAYATESLAGRALGAGGGRDLKRLLSLALGAGFSFACLFALPLIFAPRQVLALLTSHADIVELATSYAPFMVATLLTGAPAFIYDGYFLGLTAGATLRRAMTFCTLVVFLPLAAWSAVAKSPTLLWLAMVAFMIARSLTLATASRHL